MGYSDNFVDDLLDLVEDLTSAEKVDYSELLFEQSFVHSKIAEEKEVVTGVRHGQVLPILLDTPNPESFPFVDKTDCETEECDVEHEFSAHVWELGLIECRVGICLRSFNENFLKFFNVYRQTQQGEPDLDSVLLQFISGKFLKNLTLSTWRAAYFGDKSSNSAYFDGIDGIFTQLEANAGQIVTITQNAGANFAAQAITGEQVYTYLNTMYERASEQAWFDDSIVEYEVTRSMAVKLVAWLNQLADKAPNNCECIDPNSATARRVFRLQGLTLNGIPIRVRHEFDDIINYSTELNGGGGNNARVNPHRAILTYRQNLLIGTSQTDALESFDIWYSKDKKKVYLEGSSYVGGGVPLVTDYILAI